MKNLTSIVEHSDWLNAFKLKDTECWRTHRKRVNFGKQPLKLWMFVPCDEDGNVLEVPKHYGKKYTEDITEKELILHEEFVQAKERCLFEGFRVDYFDLGGAVIDKNSSFQIVKEYFQICIYKSKPDYFIWNNKNGKEHPTIEDLVKYNLELTPTASKQLE